jgi:hypothetical protein
MFYVLGTILSLRDAINSSARSTFFDWVPLGRIPLEATHDSGMNSPPVSEMMLSTIPG